MYNARGSRREFAMIIQSLLDTDLYKFTMMQVVLHHFPGAQVEYAFTCRNEGVDLRPDLDRIREEVASLCTLRFTEPELEYLRGLRFIVITSYSIHYTKLYDSTRSARILPGSGCLRP